VSAHEIVVTAGDRPDREELVALYDAVGWSTYTTDPQVLQAAIEGSTLVVTARYGGELLGLARVVSDGVSICYLQDVLVRPELQREGVGRALAQAALEPFAHCRQKVLLTDDEPRQRAFYESLGYAEIRDHGDGRLRAFVRFDEPAGAPATGAQGGDRASS
jgi:GNAT superfamily N-acetyltransferase